MLRAPRLMEQPGCHTLRSPEPPLPCIHDPKPEEQVRERMRDNTRQQTPGPVRHKIIECAGTQRRHPISLGMGECKEQSHSRERQPRKFSKRNAIEVFRNQIAKKKSPPENLFDQRDYDDQRKKPYR